VLPLLNRRTAAEARRHPQRGRHRARRPRRQTRHDARATRPLPDQAQPRTARAQRRHQAARHRQPWSTTPPPPTSCEPSPTSRRPAAPSPRNRQTSAACTAAATATAQDLTTYLRQNKDNLIRLVRRQPRHPRTAREVRPVLPLHAAHAGRLRARHGQGARQGHERAGPACRPHQRPVARPYVPGKDTPAYDASGGPQCYPVPYGGRGTTPAAARPPAAPRRRDLRGTAAPQDRPPARRQLAANSPQENQLINELLAPAIAPTPRRCRTGAAC